jgi:hypothetical protein
MDTSDAWIVERTESANVVSSTQPCGAAQLALPAALEAIQSAGLQKSDIDLLIVATTTPEHSFPVQAVIFRLYWSCRRSDSGHSCPVQWFHLWIVHCRRFYKNRTI